MAPTPEQCATMTDVAPRAGASTRPPEALFKVLNPLFGLVLRSPLHRLLSRRLILLTFTGRRSGRSFTTPVGYVRDGNSLLVATESKWQRNLRGGARVKVRLRNRDRGGTADVISDQAGLTEAYARILRRAPNLSRVIGVSLDPAGRPNPDDVE